MAEHRKHDITTRLSHAGRAGTHVHGFVNPPIHRGSTVLVENTDMRADAGTHRLEQYLIYGVLGGPTHWALENVVAEIEGGTRCQIVSSGLAAVTTPLLAYLAAGDHCLMPDSVYGPARGFANGMMKRMGIETSFYDPCITPEGLEALIQPNTKVLYLESPGSHTFEVQDVPGLSRVAHAHGAKVLMASLALGQYASPDDCWLALRGARTMAVRMERQFQSSLEVARWLSGRPEVKQVLHPGLPGAPGHDIWKRDFTGGCSLFGVVFQPGYSEAAMGAMVNSLELFGIGASWGGFESLALPSNLSITRSAGTGDFGGPMVRYHVGLEAPGDLIADLEQSLNVLRSNSLEKPQLD